MKRTRIRGLSTVGVGLLAAALMRSVPAAAQDVVVNGKFDQTIAGWPLGVNGGTIAFDPTRDADGSALSGSIEIVQTAPPPSEHSYYSLFVGGCLTNLPPAPAYFLGAKLRLREGETSKGFAFMIVHFSTTADCKGTHLGAFASSEVRTSSEERGVWYQVRGGTTTDGFTLPPGTKGVALYVYVAMTQGDQLTVNADDIYLAPVGTPMCAKLPATIIGTAGPDVITGTPGSDVIVGLAGADQIDGKGGNDRICGGAGDDTIHGGDGDDTIIGGGGADYLYGDGDDDHLEGGAGGDHLFGGSGDDVLRGGGGNDACDGGPDDDSAVGCETTTNFP